MELKEKLIKLFHESSQLVKIGDNGEYDQYKGITDDCFDDLADDMIKLTSSSFNLAYLPLIKYLNENHHPHTTIIMTSTSIELLEGIKSEINIFDYLVD